MRPFLIITAALFISVTACSQSARTDAAPTDLTVDQFKAELVKGEAVFVDVRTPQEYADGHIAGSQNIDWMAANHEKMLLTLDPKKPMLLYCQAGGRSGSAKEFLESKGYHVKHLASGFSGWEKAGEEVVR